MSYSRNFGFRSFENIVRRGRLRTPAGSAFKIGEPVILDPAAPGYMKAATAGVAPVGAGVVVFEHIQVKNVDPALSSPADFNTVPASSYAQVVSGKGVKVWLKNTAQKTLYDGRVIAAGTLLNSGVVLSGLAIGAQLTPDGSGKFKVSNGTTDGDWLTVESVNTSTATVEVSFNF